MNWNRNAIIAIVLIVLSLVAAIYFYLMDRAQPRRAALRALSLSFAFGLVLLPWTLHINGPGQPFALVTRTGYMNLFVGNHPHDLRPQLERLHQVLANIG